MSRRNISPIKGRKPIESTGVPGVPGLDERDQIIKKLKQELTLARSKEKEVNILENYMLQLKQKISILGQQIKRKESDVKNKTELSQKMINDLKRDVQIFKGELKNNSIQLGQKQATLLEMKRHLTKRTTELQKVKKQTLFLKDQNDGLMQECAASTNRFDEIQAQLRRIQATNRNYQQKISQINGRIGQAKAYIGQLNNDARILKDKLKQHEQQNNNISDDLNNKQDNIDNLQRIFSQQHDKIKGQIDNYIQLQHRNQKILTQTRHKINLNKAQNQKSNQLTISIQKIDKAIGSLSRQSASIRDKIKQYSQSNNDYNRHIGQLTNDLGKCQAHLQNLMKYNAQIQEELERYLREDEQIVALIRRKRAVDMVPLRESRKITTERTYIG